MRENNDTRRSQNITELVVIKDRENNLQFELNQVKEQLQKEKERVNHYMEQVIYEHITAVLLLGRVFASFPQNVYVWRKIKISLRPPRRNILRVVSLNDLPVTIMFCVNGF